MDDLRIAAECFEEFCRKNDVKPTNMKADYYIAGFFRGQRHEIEQVRPLAWNSTKDRMPSPGSSWVFGAYENGDLRIVRYSYAFMDWFFMDDTKADKPAYWMPIPEVPSPTN